MQTLSTHYLHALWKLRGSLHALFHPGVKLVPGWDFTSGGGEYFVFTCIFHPRVKSIHFHPCVKRNRGLKKCDVKQLNYLFFKKNEEMWMLHKVEYWEHDCKIFCRKLNKKRSGKWRTKWRSAAFKPERRFGKFFFVTSVFWHFIIQDVSGKKKVKLSNARGNCIQE